MKKLKLLTILTSAFIALTLIGCTDDNPSVDPNTDYAVAELQLKSDYRSYNIGEIKWSTERGYQIGAFAVTEKLKAESKIESKAIAQTITAWYSVVGESAKREMDTENLGVIVPEKIKAAFEATMYSDNTIWRIDEIELDHKYTNNVAQSYYEMELVNIANNNLEAELFFSYETGELIYTKEELDNDNDDSDDNDDNKFVINDQLKAAVERAVPGAVIIEAEIEDNLIEVEAIVTTDGVKKEIELEFTLNYELVSQEIETEYIYGQLPAEYEVIKTWFTANPTIAPTPNANTEVVVSQGDDIEEEHNIGAYYYEIEIDDYYSGAKEYEVEFYLNSDMEIIAVIVNDTKHS